MDKMPDGRWGESLRIVDNTTRLLGEDLKKELSGAVKFRVAAACFSIYAFEALKSELEKLNEFEFILTAPTFVPNNAIDRLKKERREFYIPNELSSSALSGSSFEIQLRNKMTQRASVRTGSDARPDSGRTLARPLCSRLLMSRSRMQVLPTCRCPARPPSILGISAAMRYQITPR